MKKALIMKGPNEMVTPPPRRLLNVFRRRSRKISFLDHYQHDCALISEDVLRAGGGAGAAARVSRWWQGLFLVSYRSQRARLFFLGSFALRNERLRQYRYHRRTIHPWSQFRIFWNKVVLCCVVVTTYMFTLTTSTLYTQETRHMGAINVICELVLLANFLLHFNIGYVDETNRSVELRRKQIVLNYMSTKAFVHLVTAIPVQIILSVAELEGSDIVCMSSLFVCTLRLLSAARLLRIMEMTSCWTLARRDTDLCICRILSTLFLVVLAMNQVICLSDTLTLIGATFDGYLPPDSFLAFMIVQKYVVNVEPLHLYFLDMARLFKAFIVSSQGFYINREPLDRVMALTTYFLGSFFYMWCLLEVVAHYHCATFTGKQKELAVDSAMSMVRARQLSDTLRGRIRVYYSFADVVKVLPPRMNEMFSSLPESLRSEVKIASWSYLLSDIQQFVGWPAPLVHALTLALRVDVYLSGDVVATAGSPVECMCIVDSGILAEYPPHDEGDGGGEGEREASSYFIDGDHFGEHCLVEGGGEEEGEARPTDLVALTDCCVVSLHRDDFRTIMADHQASTPPVPSVRRRARE